MSSDDNDAAASRRLSNEEVERIMSKYCEEDGISRERLRELLESELGWKLVDAQQRVDAAREEQREAIAAMKAYMLGTSPRNEFIYALIGEFIVKFSQIEIWLRMAFGQVTKLPRLSADLILAKLDFQSLVAVTTGFYEKEYAKAPPPLWKQVRGIFSRCLALNDERVRIAHGSWIVNESWMHALHLSRQKMEYQLHFPLHAELKAQIAKLDALDEELRKLLLGDYDPPDDDEC
jgi:hypothetical protein